MEQLIELANQNAALATAMIAVVVEVLVRAVPTKHNKSLLAILKGVGRMIDKFCEELDEVLPQNSKERRDEL